MSVKLRDVYAITEKEGRDAFWSKIGVAFVNRDESLNVVLDAIPLTGKIHIRERSTKTQKKEGME